MPIKREHFVCNIDPYACWNMSIPMLRQIHVSILSLSAVSGIDSQAELTAECYWTIMGSAAAGDTCVVQVWS